MGQVGRQGILPKPSLLPDRALTPLCLRIRSLIAAGVAPLQVEAEAEAADEAAGAGAGAARITVFRVVVQI